MSKIVSVCRVINMKLQYRTELCQIPNFLHTTSCGSQILAYNIQTAFFSAEFVTRGDSAL